ncbi:hypothetical protein KKH23_06195, partial [Patescibacteria group bacterium]|nr:hypothetical protein [Patescibacteria group bacterium]
VSYTARRSKYSDKTVLLNGGMECRDLSCGNIITLTAPAKSIAAKEYMVERISKGVASFEIACREYSADIYGDEIIVAPTGQTASDVTVSGPTSIVGDVNLGDGTDLAGTITLTPTPDKGDIYIAAGKTDFTTADDGLIIGIDDSDADKAKLYLGGDTYYLYWDGTNLVLSGNIIASSGTIGGWTIGETSLYSDNIRLDSATPSIELGNATDYLTGIGIWMGLSQSSEDYTTYTEVDIIADRLSIIADTITVTDLDTDEAVWAYYDFGLDYFDNSTDWNFKFRTKCTDQGRCGIWALTQDVGGIADLGAALKNFLYVEWWPVDNSLWIGQWHAGATGTSSTMALDLATDYYITVIIRWSESKAYLYVHTDEARTVFVDSTFIAFTNTDYFRYLFGQQGYNGAMGGSTWSGEIGDLQFSEDYKYYVGDPAGDHISWDGANLNISGTVLAGSDITGTVSDTFKINSDDDDVNVQLILGRTTGGTAVIQWNGTVISVDEAMALYKGAAIGDGGVTNYVAFSATGVATLHGSAKRKFHTRPVMDVITQIAHAVPTELTIGKYKGFAFPVGGANEEIFLRDHVPHRWDGVSDLVLRILVASGHNEAGAGGEDIGDKFQFRLAWEHSAIPGVLQATSNNVDTETTILAGRNAEDDLYWVSFTIDYDIDGVGSEIQDGAEIAANLVRIAATENEVTFEPVVLDWVMEYQIDKYYGAGD